MVSTVLLFFYLSVIFLYLFFLFLHCAFLVFSCFAAVFSFIAVIFSNSATSNCLKLNRYLNKQFQTVYPLSAISRPSQALSSNFSNAFAFHFFGALYNKFQLSTEVVVIGFPLRRICWHCVRV